MLTARVTSGPRISIVASAPSTITDPSALHAQLEVARHAGHRLDVGGIDAAAQGGERHRAVHRAGVEVLAGRAAAATALATVDLPDPAGPSMAIRRIGGVWSPSAIAPAP